MKALIRVCGLAVVLVLASFSSASGYVFGCYVSCPDNNYYIQASQCCGQIPRYEFTCPPKRFHPLSQAQFIQSLSRLPPRFPWQTYSRSSGFYSRPRVLAGGSLVPF